MRWAVSALIAVSAGVLVAVLIWFVTIRIFNVFGMSLGQVTYLWLAAACAGISLTLTNLRKTRPLRRIVSVVSAVLFLVAGTLGINADFGLDRTRGSLVGISTLKPIAMTPPTGAPPTNHPAEPLWRSWTPPAGLASTGTLGTQVIPNTISGFSSRPAGIYLPPAALVPNAPALPLVVMLMGQPGNPDPEYIAATLDREGARHGGLAPIVIVANQLGDPGLDPLCLDTAAHGRAETFLTQEVMNWARANLNIIQDHRYWTIAGYSNGGQCAISLGAKHPDLWSNIVDISGEEFPGSEIQTATLRDVFGGDQTAYDAQKPVNLLAGHHYPGTVAVFTVGSNDTGFIPGQRFLAGAAKNAGMTVTYWETPNGGHVLPALTDGLDKAFEVLYPHLGLAPPSPP
jgi:S-formylglutathione hydrolase FrmB